MKKILNIITVLVATISLSSCNLDLDPVTELPGEESATPEYVEAMRAGVYTGLKSITSGGMLYNADYYVDLVNQTYNSGNRGGNMYNWRVYSNDQEIESIWGNYYGFINRINFAIMKAEETMLIDTNTEAAMKLYIGEFRFFRAYAFHQLALRFCQDYDPAKASTQLGVPLPLSYDPEAQLPRGTLADVYTQIDKDVAAAKIVVTDQGEANAIYLTLDAITAFEAQVALQKHEYAKASELALSLKTRYPLITSKNDLEKMWREDSSTETILQPDLRITSIGSVGSMSDYYMGTWNKSSRSYVCAPAYTLAGMPAEIYSEDDYRVGVYVDNSDIGIFGMSVKGFLLTKFLGNKLLQTSPTSLSYRCAPKVFRIAEMLLIAAEAQYRENGGGLEPLNELRVSRGLAAGSETGEELFQAIKDERIREMLGEGQRLTDLKRWDEGFQRRAQKSVAQVLTAGASMKQLAGANGFVWPIPINEITRNKNFGEQNPGYSSGE